MVPTPQFVPHASVILALRQDEEACLAIEQSRCSLPTFAAALERRAARQVGFLVTVMRREHDTLVPVGILVERIDGKAMYGREVRNSLVAHPGDPLACNFDDVVDWRYEDTFELEGGALYRLYFHRLPFTAQGRIGEQQQFLVDWYDKNAVGDAIVKDVELRDLFRDVANLRYGEVERKLKADRTLGLKTTYVPTPGGAIRARLRRMSVSNQAAAFGDARMIRLLSDLKVLQEDKGKDPPLVEAAVWGNVATSGEMLRLGFDVEVLDDSQISALRLAVDRDYGPLVALLLEHGADCDRRDNGLMTPLFHVESIGVAKQLLNAGARFDLVDDEGRTCVQWHLEHGRSDIADVLVRQGARRDRDWEVGLTEEQVRERGREVLRNHFRFNQNALADLEMSESIDFGCVLPLQGIELTSSQATVLPVAFFARPGRFVASSNRIASGEVSATEPQVLGVHSVEASVPCYLIEMTLPLVADAFDWGEVTQEDVSQPRSNWPVAYDEVLLDSEERRWAFFFHFLQLDRPLSTPLGEVALPTPTPVPQHLSGIGYTEP